MNGTQEYWYPNAWHDAGADIDSLEPWQLLVAACHFAPSMTDCVEYNYGYRFQDGEIYLDGAGGKEVCLHGDIDMTQPMLALNSYLGFSWKKYARQSLEERVKK